ncbi:MAG: single-stranded-DNA-specific exonuclease RecJ [Candidatus Levybacteria bacterium RIFCSPHIGHO2_02_FULL_37_10]|nr:MAG: single-stranded-DNA-specific exonuclease RecJ [Candidatus Levybacteria bacterium RIFCSPHIGHO2_02_FULL_37_10]
MKFKVQNSKFKIEKKESGIKDLINILLVNRGAKTKKEIEEFLNPKLKNVSTNSVGINKKQLSKAVSRIQNAIKNKENIVVFGDYDVDGICGTAILWETLNSLGAKVMPYIPHRIDEGYGLSLAGISNLKSQISNVRLIITVDNGIVANKAVDFANDQDIDVIITDHHVPSKVLPKAFATVHTTKLCGTGVAYILSQEIQKILNTKYLIHNTHLELVALATVADLVPLKGANRTLLKFGLEQLQKTTRRGLLELFKEAGLQKDAIGVYEIGHMIAPRLNAMGRLEYAMDSLRLICTNNKKRAEDLAYLLGSTNKERQDLTLQNVLHAIERVKKQKSKVKNLLFIVHESYEQGVIGLVAGKLVEEFYKPAIVVSKGERYSKASARSVSGFNIIEFIRSASELLVDAGGHPMAAGFTVETTKLLKLQKVLEEKAELILTEDLLIRSLKIDCELPLEFIDINLYESLQKLAPFGMGNPEPVFISRNVVIEDIRLVGMEGKHLKINVKCQMSNVKFSAIGFGMGKMFSKIKIGDRIDIAYTIDINEWNGEQRLQLKIKDIMN